MAVWLFGMGFGTWLSLRPGGTAAPWFSHADKVIHASGYAVLAGMAVCLYRPPRARVLALLGILALGGFIEIAQGLWAINRSMELADFLADALGIAIGAFGFGRGNALRRIEQGLLARK